MALRFPGALKSCANTLWVSLAINQHTTCTLANLGQRSSFVDTSNTAVGELINDRYTLILRPCGVLESRGVQLVEI